MLLKFKESLSKLTGLQEIHPASPDNPKILVAVSGGIDSMCLAHLFHRIFYKNFAIATVNFSLRGEESDGDEELVRSWAEERGIEYFSNIFDTKEYCRVKGVSTQAAARDLRYSWFNLLMAEHSFDYLAVAHNLNDSVETFFLNILRGTGIQGLTGIRRKNGKIIRPLLSITRREIAEFVKREDIPFREDSSNSQSYYSRNRIRNMVFPEFEMINASFLGTVEKDMANVEAAADILEELYFTKKAELLDYKRSRIELNKLLKERRPDYWLYMILSEYGFNADQTEQIYSSLEGQPGKEFHSDSHLVLKDREYLLIYPKGVARGESGELNDSESRLSSTSGPVLSLAEFEERLADQKDNAQAQAEVEVHDYDNELFEVSLKGSRELKEYAILGFLVRISVYPKPAGFKFKDGPRKIEYTADLFGNTDLSAAAAVRINYKVNEPSLLLDADLLEFPLICRRWSEGDKFMPLGMTGYKKVSDYLTDIKMDKVSKSYQPVMTSGDKIVALIGQRIDERYKITAHTKNILEITIIN
jgi:tRNA(Ile)-lysidine synthase